MTQEEKLSLLIPRYLRGELSAEESAELESYLSDNPDFQAEIEFQQKLMSARPDTAEQSDTEFGWARLSRSIDQLEADKTDHISHSIQTTRETSIFQGMWKIAAVFLACLSIGQAFYISKSQSDQHYQLASEADKPGTTLQIGFSNETNFRDLTKFSLDHNAQIISGPSKLGIYTLAFPDSEQCLSAVRVLSSEEKLVETYTSCNTNSQHD